MKHTMGKPCAHCPFRTDIQGYLRRERVIEIAESLFQGASFPCHETTEAWDDDDDGERHATDDSQQCAGAEIFLAKQGMSTQLGRIAERLGMKVAKLDKKSPVCSSVSEMIRVHVGDDEEEGETCCVCDHGCEAPAGYFVGGGVLPGEGSAEFCCYGCGEPVCGACSNPIKGQRGERLCNNCAEDDDE